MLDVFILYLVPSISSISYTIVECDKSRPDSVFNLCFQFPNKSLIKTTFSNSGYGVRIKVDSLEKDVNTSSVLFEEIQLDTYVESDGDGARISHIFTNTGTKSKKVSFFSKFSILSSNYNRRYLILAYQRC